MNLHLFPADDKLFVPKFVRTIKDGGYDKNNLLMCYVQEMVISDIVLPFAAPAVVLMTIKGDSVNRIIFHSLQPQAFPLVKIIKEKAPECRIDWIYWGESYDNPSSLMGDHTIIEYIRERGVPRWLSALAVKMRLAHSLLNFRTSRFRSRILRLIKYIDTFYHWSQIDYEHIKKIFNHSQLKYQKFFYDVFNFQIIDNQIIEHELDCNASNCIVLGHSVSMRNNHLDILPVVSEFAIKNNKTIICPLSYGSASKKYVQAITKYMAGLPKLSYRVLNKFYSETEYFAFLSKCGAYIAPGCGSLGAGNMIGYVLAGRVPIVDRWNTTGEFLKSIGADVAIYDNIRDLKKLLEDFFGAYSEKNRIIVSDYFSAINKLKCYEKLLANV